MPKIEHPLSCYIISPPTFRGGILDIMNMQSGNRTRGPKWSYDETLATFGLVHDVESATAERQE